MTQLLKLFKDWLDSAVASCLLQREMVSENGMVNGRHAKKPRLEEETFLFTSESVGVGHPGNVICSLLSISVISKANSGAVDVINFI